MRSRCVAVGLLGMCLAVAGCVDASPRAGAPSLEDDLAAALESARLRAGIPGAQAAVVFGDGSTWSGASGTADVETSEAVDDETLFGVGSITKPVTAALVVDLASEGRLDLGDPVTEWLEWFERGNGVTIRQLLSHTSGLGDPFESERFHEAMRREPDRAWAPRAVLRHMTRRGCAPGTCWSYSNANYVLLGLIARRAGGAPAGTLMEERLFAPLGVRDVFLQSETIPGNDVATGYGYELAELVSQSAGRGYAPYRSFATAASTAGGIAASAEDLAAFFSSLFAREIGPPGLVREMTDVSSSEVPGTVPCGRYGLGLDTGTAEGGELTWGHNGGMPGFRSEMTFFPGAGVTIVVLTNSSGDGPLEAAQGLATVLRSRGLLDGSRPGICNTDLYSTGPDGDERRLTRHPGVDGGTISQPAGRDAIVFGSVRTGSAQIHVLDLETGAYELVSRGPGPNRGASWSPDGTRVAYADSHDGDDEIVVVDLRTGELRRLTDNDVPDTVPTWSPDGEHIAFSRGFWGSRDVWMMSPDGSEQRPLTTALVDEWWPAWSPDGSEIAYVNDSVGEIDAVTVDGSGYRRLTDSSAVEGFPSWSKTGRIAFLRDGDVWVMNHDGSSKRRLTRTAYREYAPAWSSDGLTVFYPRAAPLSETGST